MIGPETVLEAYKATGLRPTTQKYVRRYRRQPVACCAIAAVIFSRRPKEEWEEITKLLLAVGVYSFLYTVSEMRPSECYNFINGFDGSPIPAYTNTSYRKAHVAGRATRELLIEKGLL